MAGMAGIMAGSWLLDRRAISGLQVIGLMHGPQSKFAGRGYTLTSERR